ncbi:MAG: glycosyltransferase [Bacteroidetes bacterium]|nr:glycosyltransferase [Bacteroidota bacterium]
MIKDQDIVIVGLQPWDIPIGSNCINIAKELSKYNRVLYVNPPLDRSTYIKGRNDERVKRRIEVVRGKKDGLSRISENLWTLYPKQLAESINWINNSSMFHWLNKINNRRFSSDIRSAMNRIRMRRFILFNDQSMIRSFHLKEMLKPELFIYYIRDNLSSIPYFQKHALDLEEKLIADADIVATNSDYLATYARKFNPAAEMVGQGCDFTLYADAAEIPFAKELVDMKGPIIGYTGFLTSIRLDIGVLERVAENRPDWQIVLVGPEDDAFKNSALHKMNNVHFLGNKPPENLPSYIKSFDVAINPQVVNAVTMGNYPRKIDEYLALGKPVVATYTPFMEYFKDYTYLAKSAAEFEPLIAKALEDNREDLEKSRRSFALTHTWEANVEAISKLIEQKELIDVKTHY